MTMCDFCRYNCVTKLVTVMKQNFLLPTLVFLFVALFALPANAQRPGGTRGSSTTTATSRADTRPAATRSTRVSTNRQTSSRPQATTRRTNPTPTTSTRRTFPTSTTSTRRTNPTPTSTNRNTNPNYCPPGGTTATNRRRASTQATGNSRRVNQGGGAARANTRPVTRSANTRVTTNRADRADRATELKTNGRSINFDDVYASRSKRN